MALALNKPVFIDIDPEKITQELVERYERESGKKLYPGQIEMLILNQYAYRETLLCANIQDAAQQNLVAFARAPMLDYLGELVGVYRLPPQPAKTPLRFATDTAVLMPLPIPAGTRVSATDSIIFTTDNDVMMAAGTSLIEVGATCSDAGVVGNGWQPAQISTLLDDIGEGVDLQVSNIGISSGGEEQEEDDRLRERIKLAPESFSNAGSRQAYRFHAMSVHQAITDVAVTRPVPGTVNLYPLLTTGLPDDTLLSLVSSYCSDEKMRPLTDTVQVLKPVQVDFAVTAAITVLSGQDAQLVMSNAQTAIEQYVTGLSAKLGQDINPGKMEAVMYVTGVYDIVLTEPVSRQVLVDHQWPHCTAINLTLAGTEHG